MRLSTPTVPHRGGNSPTPGRRLLGPAAVHGDEEARAVEETDVEREDLLVACETAWGA